MQPVLDWFRLVFGGIRSAVDDIAECISGHQTAHRKLKALARCLADIELAFNAFVVDGVGPLPWTSISRCYVQTDGGRILCVPKSICENLPAGQSDSSVETFSVSL